VFLDDQIWSVQRSKTLSLVVLLDNANEFDLVAGEVAQIQVSVDTAEFLDLAESTFLVNDASWCTGKEKTVPGQTDRKFDKKFHVVSSEEMVKKPVQRFPNPKAYDCLRIRKEHSGMRYILLRPGRYVSDLDQDSCCFLLQLWTIDGYKYNRRCTWIQAPVDVDRLLYPRVG
jgi:hypothetical protein